MCIWTEYRYLLITILVFTFLMIICQNENFSRKTRRYTKPKRFVGLNRKRRSSLPKKHTPVTQTIETREPTKYIYNDYNYYYEDSPSWYEYLYPWNWNYGWFGYPSVYDQRYSVPFLANEDDQYENYDEDFEEDYE